MNELKKIRTYNKKTSSSFRKNNKKINKVILFDHFTFDDFNPFERVDFFGVVVNFGS